MPKRSKSSARWLAEHANDEFVKRAQREGWRSRAVFKLQEIQEKERLLGRASGAWTWGRARRLEPVRGALGRGGAARGHRHPAHGGHSRRHFVQGDFRDEAVLAQVLGAVGARKSTLFCPIWPQTWPV
jgi:23S rRNA (uridine2552-2'-O)-methyltransferase